VSGKAKTFLMAVGVGLYAAGALGWVNVAAHQAEWGLRILYGTAGLFAAFCAFCDARGIETR